MTNNILETVKTLKELGFTNEQIATMVGNTTEQPVVTVAKATVQDPNVLHDEGLELICNSKDRTLTFNKSVKSLIWSANYYALKAKFPAMRYKDGAFKWFKKDQAEFVLACQTFKVIDTLSVAQQIATYEAINESKNKEVEKLFEEIEKNNAEIARLKALK